MTDTTAAFIGGMAIGWAIGLLTVGVTTARMLRRARTELRRQRLYDSASRTYTPKDPATGMAEFVSEVKCAKGKIVGGVRIEAVEQTGPREVTITGRKVGSWEAV